MQRFRLVIVTAFSVFVSSSALAHDQACHWDDFTNFSILGCLHNTKHTINGIFNSVTSKSEGTLLDVASDTLDATKSIKGTTQIIQSSYSAIENVYSNIMDMANQSEQLIEYYAQHELEPMNAWLGDGCTEGTPCDNFRSQLGTAFSDMEQALNSLVEFQYAMTNGAALTTGFTFQPLPPLDLSPLLIQIENVPGIVLFALHKGLSVGESGIAGASLQNYSASVSVAPGMDCEGGGCSELLTAIISMMVPMKNLQNLLVPASVAKTPKGLEGIEGLTEVDFANSTEAIGDWFFGCERLLPSPETGNFEFQSAAATVKGGGIFVKFISAMVGIAGPLSVDRVVGGVAAGAEASVSVKLNVAEAIAIFLEGLGDLAISVGEDMEQSLDNCESRADYEVAMCYQEMTMCMLEPSYQGRAKSNKMYLIDWCYDRVSEGYSNCPKPWSYVL